VLACVLALASPTACTGEEPRDLPDVAIPDEPVASPSTATGPVEPTETSVPPDVGRLAVIDASGSLLSIRPDGSDAVVLAEASPTVGVRQPSWSPDGSRVAWVRLEAAGADARSTLATSGPVGERPTEAPIPFAAFYLSWDPTSSQVAFLGSRSAGTLGLGLVDVEGGGTEGRALDSGQPYYFSWSPSGEQILVHVGTERLEVVGLDGSRTEVGDAPGTFRAPAWSADGRTMVYARRAGDAQELVVRDLRNGSTRVLLPFEGTIGFVLSPDGGKVAVQALGGEGGPTPLFVIDLASGEATEITTDLAAAFYWSPTGDRLLFLTPELFQQIVLLRAHVWDGSSRLAFARFLPSPAWAEEYLPFFDQYAQSMSLWSPDGAAFAYPGVSEDAQAGVWVQEVRPNVAPVLVAEGGAVVAWSPA
jgi:TolB protein